MNRICSALIQISQFQSLFESTEITRINIGSGKGPTPNSEKPLAKPNMSQFTDRHVSPGISLLNLPKSYSTHVSIYIGTLWFKVQHAIILFRNLSILSGWAVYYMLKLRFVLYTSNICYNNELYIMYFIFILENRLSKHAFNGCLVQLQNCYKRCLWQKFQL